MKEIERSVEAIDLAYRLFDDLSAEREFLKEHFGEEFFEKYFTKKKREAKRKK